MEDKIKSKTVLALEHTLNRLNSIPHKYSETDFKLLEDTLKDRYEGEGIPNRSRLPHLRRKAYE
jgi:hypothetical protein